MTTPAPDWIPELWASVNDDTPGAQRPEAIHLAPHNSIALVTLSLLSEPERHALIAIVLGAPRLLDAAEAFIQAMYDGKEGEPELALLEAAARACRQPPTIRP